MFANFLLSKQSIFQYLKNVLQNREFLKRMDIALIFKSISSSFLDYMTYIVV